MENKFCYDEVPVVEIESGKLQGYSYNDVFIYKGIPYAYAERFQMPVKFPKWEGVRSAHSYGYACPLLSEIIPNEELLVPHRYWPRNEHCHNLNIWTKSLDENARKPVLVWIHGGAFSAGSSIEQVAFDGANMCKNGEVVVVSVNHRVNILGYLDLSPFGEKYENSGNLGQADLVAALRWIRDNIRKFGGNPDNVTLFGQSGGGMKITGLMQTPEANGLFHKVVVMSGVTDGKILPPVQGDGKEIVNAMLCELGLKEHEVNKLENLPYIELATVYNKVCGEVARKGYYIGCVPKPNKYYLGDPLINGFTEHGKKIPMMIGTVFAEFAFRPVKYDKNKLTEEEINEMMQERFGSHAEEMEKLFKKAYPDKNRVDIFDLDRIFRGPSKALAQRHAQSGQAPVWMYEFTFEFPYQHGKLAWHCSDIPFFFHNTDKVEICNVPGVTSELEDKMFHSLIQFAKTGDPNYDQLPEWKPVQFEYEPTMIFDRICRVVDNFDTELLRKFEEIAPLDLVTMMSQNIQH